MCCAGSCAARSARASALELEPGFLNRYAVTVTELMGTEYSALREHSDSVRKWLESEEESFGRTLEQGSKLLDELIARARESGAEGISGEDAFRLHDTYGFPIDLTLEIVAEHDLGVDEQGFEANMNEQRDARPGELGPRPRPGVSGAGSGVRRRSRVRDRLRRL